MLIVIHASHVVLCEWPDTTTVEHDLPIDISRTQIEVCESDACETIVQPPITPDEVRTLRRAAIEWELDDLADALDGMVITGLEEVR